MFFWSKKIKADFSFLGTDMHNHLLPELDDGSKSIEESIAHIQKLQELGYQKLYCTPHVISGMYNNSPRTILPALEKLNKALQENGVDVEVKAAAEYMVDHELENLIHQNQQLLTFGTNYILIEMSYAAPSSFIDSVIFELKLKGLQPVLAHPERYGYLHQNFGQYINFIDRGCLLQLNVLSLSGYYGAPVKKIAEKLLKEKMISFVGTDLHHQNHLHALELMGQDASIMKLFSQQEFLNSSL